MDPLDSLLHALGGFDHLDLLTEAEAVADAEAVVAEVASGVGLDLWASIPVIPSGRIIVTAAPLPVETAPVPSAPKGKLTAAERARLMAERARLKADQRIRNKDAKDAKVAAALAAALQQIAQLKAFIRAAGLKVPSKT